MVLSSLNRIFAVENIYTMRKTVHYIILLTLVLSACTSPDHEAMRQRLKYVSDCNRADTVFSECWIPTVDSLVSYFDHHGSENDRMMAHYVQGRVYHDMGEAPKALECYQKAAEQADTTRSDCDLYTLYAVFGQMATLFHSQYLPDDEMQALKTAERIAWKDHDTLAALKKYELRIRPYFLRNEKDSMLYVMEDVREKYSRNGYRKEAAQAIFPAIDIYLERNQLQQAEYYLNYYEKESGNFDNNGDLIYGGAYYYNKGYHLLAVGQDEAACIYFYKALDRGQKEAGYYGLLSLYEKRNEPDSIAKYAKLFASANDSSYLHVNQKKVHQISAMYNYSHQQQITYQKEKEVSKLKYTITVIVIIVIISTLFLALLFYFYRTQRLSKYNQLMEKKTELENLLTEKLQEMELNKSNAVTISDRQYEEIEQLKKQIIDLQNRLSSSIAGKQKLFYDSEIYLFLMSFKADASFYNPPSEQEWQTLTRLFRESFPNYHKFITENNHLTQDQYRICVLARLFLPVYAMARILDVDGDRITRIKAQANRKIFGEDTAKTLGINLKPYFDE